MELLEGRIGGRPSVQFHAEVVRDLDDNDLLLRRVTSVDSEIRPIVKLRYQHHKLAQMLASGFKPGEASLQTGYSLSRISILQRDPAFRELLAHYEKNNIQVMTDLQTRMAGFATDVLDELQDRLEIKPDEMTNRELIEAAKIANDRGGNSPISRSQVQIATLTPADIKAIKEEVRAAENGRIIEHRGNATEALPYHPGIALESLDGGATPEEVDQEGAPQRVPSQGEDL